MKEVAGVALESYAFVHAALGEGHALSAVLEHEGHDPVTWASIDEAWADALSESIETDFVLSDAYDANLLNWQDRFTRSVAPLDTEYAQYMRFVRHWSTHEAPQQFLATNGLRTPDLLRLQRQWSERIYAEPDLRREAAEAAAEPETIPAPAVVVGLPRTLTDVRPASPPRPAPPPPREATAAPPHLPPLLAPLPEKHTDNAAALQQALGLARQPPAELEPRPFVDMTVERYGELQAHLAAYGDSSPVYERFGIDAAQLAAIDRLFAERFAVDPSLAPRFDRAYSETYDGLRRRK